MQVHPKVSDLTDAYFGAFGGDDSVVLFRPSKRTIDNSKSLTTTFNLISKLERYSNSIYFLCKFLIQCYGIWYRVPNPLKAVVLLGRNDLTCMEHINYCYISFCDNLNSLNSSCLCEILDMALIDRYGNRIKSKFQTFRLLPFF